MKSTPTIQHHNFYRITTLITFGLVIIFSVLMLITFSVSTRVNNTSVGFIFLGNVSESRYDTVLNNGIDVWQAQTEYQLIYYGETIPITLNWLEFNLEETKTNIRLNQDNQAHFDISSEAMSQFTDLLQGTLGDTLFQQFDLNAFIEDIQSDAMSLSRFKTYYLDHYLESTLFEEVISQFIIDGLNEADIDQIVSQFSTWDLGPTMSFSMLNATKNTTLNNVQLSIVASGILNVILDSHLTLIDYHIHQYLPTWGSAGSNVRILRLNQYDFTFYNPLKDELSISIEKLDQDSLQFKLKGYPYVQPYHHETELIETITHAIDIITNVAIDQTTPGVIITETDTEYIYDLVVQQGRDGAIYYVNRIYHDLNNQEMVLRIMIEHYMPVTEIIHRHIVQKGG